MSGVWVYGAEAVGGCGACEASPGKEASWRGLASSRGSTARSVGVWGKVPKLPKTVAADMNAADEGLEGTQRPEVTPRVKANKSAMATLLSGRRG